MRLPRNVLRNSAIAVVALAMWGGGASAANAATGSNPSGGVTTTKTSVEPMVDGGFDAAVAKANGFKIKTAQDGSQTSVPITASAKRMVAAGTVDSSPSFASAATTSAPSGLSTNGVTPGTCGTSDVTATKTANDVLKIYTGYTVGFSVQNRVWEVTAAGLIAGHNFDFPQGGSGPTWHMGMQHAVPGPGLASVQLFSFVVGYNGKICHSNGPIDSYS